MAQLVKDYNFGFPLRNVQQLDAIEQNILTDDKYATSLVRSQYKFPFDFSIILLYLPTQIIHILTNIEELKQKKIIKRIDEDKEEKGIFRDFVFMCSIKQILTLSSCSVSSIFYVL